MHAAFCCGDFFYRIYYITETHNFIPFCLKSLWCRAPLSLLPISPFCFHFQLTLILIPVQNANKYSSTCISFIVRLTCSLTILKHDLINVVFCLSAPRFRIVFSKSSNRPPLHSVICRLSAAYFISSLLSYGTTRGTQRWCMIQKRDWWVIPPSVKQSKIVSPSISRHQPPLPP